MLHDLREIPVIDSSHSWHFMDAQPRLSGHGRIALQNIVGGDSRCHRPLGGSSRLHCLPRRYFPIFLASCELRTCPSAMRGRSDWAFRNAQRSL
jgi:hypothetical protein